MEATPSSPAELVWSGEVRLTVLVPPDWSDSDQHNLDVLLTRAASQLRDALRTVLPERCSVESSVA